MSEGMKDNQISKSEDLPFGVRLKKYKMLFSYYFRGYRKRIKPFTIILFLLSLFLFSIILIPNIALHKLPILGEWPMVLELDGSVLIKTNENNSSKLIGVTKATIEIGGYKSITDQEGSFPHQVCF